MDNSTSALFSSLFGLSTNLIFMKHSVFRIFFAGFWLSVVVLIFSICVSVLNDSLNRIWSQIIYNWSQINARSLDRAHTLPNPWCIWRLYGSQMCGKNSQFRLCHPIYTLYAYCTHSRRTKRFSYQNEAAAADTLTTASNFPTILDLGFSSSE